MYKNFFDISAYTDEELAVIEKLLVFDKKAYLEKFPDVANTKTDPLIHFLTQGMYEGRFPWSINTQTAQEQQARLLSSQTSLRDILGFDEEFYKKQYPDVTQNHFRHFILNGIRENRLPFNFNDNVDSETLTWNILSRFNIACDNSLDRQLRFEVKNGPALLQALFDEASKKGLVPKTYRNNYWLALAIAFSACGYFGASALCYNYFFNYFLPMPHLNNWREGVYVVGKIHKIVQFAQNRRWFVKKLSAASSISVPDPHFLNRPNTIGEVEIHPLPTPYYCILENVVLIGGSAMIIANSHDLLYDHLDDTTDNTSEIKCHYILHAVNNVCAVKYTYTDLYVPEAFSLMHDHGHNYFHWIIEVLPRYLLARKNGLACNATFLIDEKIGKLQEAVIRLILGNDAIVIKVARNASVKVGKLHWVSDLSINTVRTLQLPKKSDILISPTAVELLKELAADHATQGIAKYERILITRTNVEFRRLVNRELCREMLIREGFWDFDPGRASFEEQIRVFSNAKIIVSEAGAAQANLVFCRPGTIVVVLVNGYKNSNYFYLAEMAQIAKLKLVFFECFRLDGSHELGVHDDMIVNISDLRNHINNLTNSANSSGKREKRQSKQPTILN
ncbi:glycosyltransferase 61 family protein [Methylomonas sp. UP202]|uniref:glycosyltransferase family 61 protein n=1 Tax=Methylomonas sp. UP202 TaxID=3040943 RepID=UPI002479E877|nr:glycosyltransferase 61 family protein [Methylomonas sp. UP202]WGS85592.1 glycosyltransferase 61 family protein [Methylomonas sp. UP202]